MRRIDELRIGNMDHVAIFSYGVVLGVALKRPAGFTGVEDVIAKRCFVGSNDNRFKSFVRGHVRLTSGIGSVHSDDYWAPALVEYFTGHFNFDQKQGGFVPVMRTATLPRWMAVRLKDDEPSRIRKRWDVLKPIVLVSGAKASLITHCEQQHVYFMECMKSGLIKIGISVQPEIRRQQIVRKRQEPVRILKIISSGGPEMEKDLHHRFRMHRIRDEREYFLPGPDLMAFIAEAG